MILRSERIARLLQEGEAKDVSDPLIITPQPEIGQLESSGAASIDLRLGTWFVALRPARLSCLDVGGVDSELRLTKNHYVPFGGDYYLHPRNFVLATTLEWLRLPKDLAGYVVGRSSWGRRGLIIATAVAVHPGFRGCLTLELSNVGEIPIKLRPGLPICQLCLHSVEGKATDAIDRSQFVGSRRPSLGQVRLDPFAEKLATVQPDLTAHRPSNIPQSI